MSAAATRNCCAALNAHAEQQHADDQPAKLCKHHREPDGDRTDQRQPEPELDAGLAAIGVGDLADRIGHQEPADAEQRDRQSRRGSPSRSARSPSAARRRRRAGVPAPMNDCDSANSAVLRLISGGMRPVAGRGTGWCMRGCEAMPRPILPWSFARRGPRRCRAARLAPVRDRYQGVARVPTPPRACRQGAGVMTALAPFRPWQFRTMLARRARKVARLAEPRWRRLRWPSSRASWKPSATRRCVRINKLAPDGRQPVRQGRGLQPARLGQGPPRARRDRGRREDAASSSPARPWSRRPAATPASASPWCAPQRAIRWSSRWRRASASSGAS